jgi:hypothetical protein
MSRLTESDLAVYGRVASMDYQPTKAWCLSAVNELLTEVRLLRAELEEARAPHHEWQGGGMVHAKPVSR